MRMKILALSGAFLLIASALFVVGTSRAQNPVFFSAEPVAVPPLADTNSSLNGLETPATPSPVGQNFTVEIHLRGATLDNAPNGIIGLEVHLNFSNILAYAVPTGFTDFVGQTGGVLVPAILYGIAPAFFAANGSKVTTAPYAGAVEFEEAAASSSGTGWNGADGLVAKVTFKIIKQPNGTNGEPTVSFPLVLDFTDVYDTLANEVNHDAIGGTLTIDSTGGGPPPPSQYTLTVNTVGTGNVTWSPLNATYASGTIVTLTATPGANWTFQSWSGNLTGTQNPINITMTGNATVTATFVFSGTGIPGDLNHDGKVDLQDLVVFAKAWRTHTGDPNYNPECDLAPPYGYISLTDFVTFCVNYGKSLHS